MTVAALKAVGWGVALAIAGLGLGFLYATVFAGQRSDGLEGMVPIMVGLFMGGVTGVVASTTLSFSGSDTAPPEGRGMALAMIGPPVALGLFAVTLQVLRSGVDLLPASMIMGVIGGLGVGGAWAFSKRRGMRANPVVAIVVWGVLAATAWLLGQALGASTANENSLHPEFFLYLTMILPLQIAAPVSAAVLPQKSAAVRT